MSTGLKVLLGFLGGLGVGFTAGFLFHKKSTDVEFEEVTEEEMALLEEQASKPKEEKPKGDPILEKYPSVQDLPEDPDKMRLALQGKKSYVQAENEEKEKYARIWQTVKDYSNEYNANELPIESENVEEEFDENFMEAIQEDDVNPGSISPPVQIGMVEFYNERPEYDKITIEWFEPDNTFIDEREEVIGDIRSYVGDLNVAEAFRKLNPEIEEPDILFVRNEQYGTDYEIIRHHKSYFDHTGGEA